MPRWEPDAKGRLARAALELFTERGYDDTTVVDIARRAELGKTTFFRHFADKREVLFGGDDIAGLLVGAILAAPPTASPLEAVARALDAAGDEVFTPDRRDATLRRQAVIAANPELREREALKNLGLTAVMADGLRQRGVPDVTSRVCAELATLASTLAFQRWSEAEAGEDFTGLARQALADVRESTCSL